MGVKQGCRRREKRERVEGEGKRMEGKRGVRGKAGREVRKGGGAGEKRGWGEGREGEDKGGGGVEKLREGVQEEGGRGSNAPSSLGAGP